MKIVFLEGDTLGADVNLGIFRRLGDVELHGLCSQEEIPEHIKDAEVVIVNKLLMNEQSLKGAEKLKLICVAATGTNNIDREYVKSRGIRVTNVAGYSTATVAQHTFALLFYLVEKMKYYDEYVKSGEYCESPMFTHFGPAFMELKDKVWGIIGLGAIGRQVADIAAAFGCKVVYYSTSGKNSNPDYRQVDFNTLLKASDIISVHAPLTEQTRNLIAKEELVSMKKTAFLINLSRGQLVDEADLAWALEQGEIAGAGLDVLCSEPIEKDNPLLQIMDSGKLVITPHIAWASTEARKRLAEEVYKNIEAYKNEEDRNIVC